MIFLRQYGPLIATLLIFLFTGTGGFYQVTSGLFYCGMTGAMPEIFYWSIFISCQSILFMATPLFERAKKVYLFSQLIALPFLILVLAQLVDAYPRPFVTVGGMLGIYCYLRFSTTKLLHNSSSIKQRLDPTELLTEGSIFVLTTLLIQSALAFFILYKSGARLTDRWFFCIFAFSSALAYFLVRKGCLIRRIRVSEFPPLFLLIFFLLRAKLPDEAYDSLFYKATLPIMIADWRTALTGTFDHTLLGTNFLEIVNSQIRIFDPTYSPAMTGAFAFIGMWIIAPRAAASFLRRTDDSRGLVRNATILLLVSLTEPLTAAGTAYQEPFLILLITASVLAGPLGWFLIASAISVKITTLFFVPFWLLLRVMIVDRKGVLRFILKLVSVCHLKYAKPLSSFQWASKSKMRLKRYLSRAALVICLLLSLIVIGEQFYRNYVFTARVFVPSESLVSLTDPNGEVLKRVSSEQVFDAVAQRSILGSVGGTAVYMLTLNKLIETSETGFFHVFPSSRLPLVAILLCISLIFFKEFRSDRRSVCLMIGYVISFVIFLRFFSQGRHMAVASIFAIFVVIAMLSHLVKLAKKSNYSLVFLSFTAFGIAFFAISDQTVGSYINDGWDCRRPLLETPIRPVYEKTEKTTNDVNSVLEDVVQQYKNEHGTAYGVIPSILCESKIEKQTYFGAHYIYSVPSQNLLENYLDVDSKRAARLPYSLLAICFENERFFTNLMPQDIRSQFTQFAKVGNVTIMASKPLLSGAVAESLNKKGFIWSQQVNDEKFTSYNFIEKWLGDGKIVNDYPAETPTGKGALKLIYDNTDCATLISPYSIQFSKVPFVIGDSIELEYAMPYRDSDGMDIKLIVIVGDKQHIVQFPVSPSFDWGGQMNWEKTSVKIPPELSGEGMVIISALSESGNSAADWIVFRKLIVQRVSDKN